ncbi:hypothetical protein BAUCODRAFT_34646, partial [Baudoinia panamericana UAMH 10762]
MCWTSRDGGTGNDRYFPRVLRRIRQELLAINNNRFCGEPEGPLSEAGNCGDCERSSLSVYLQAFRYFYKLDVLGRSDYPSP